MLLAFPSFLLKQAVRSPVYLFNPPVVSEELVSLPRYSVIHHLDTRDSNHFISRDNYYFRNIADNKKIPIFHIADLLYKEDVTALENKQFLGEIRKWTQANLHAFKSRDLLNQPNDDVNVVSVFNYNILKDMYKYKGSLLTKHYAYQNLYKTYYHYVKTAINLDKDSYHFITLDLPTSIPTFNVVNMMIKFSAAKFSRVVTDNNLMKVIDLYRWLSDDSRATSTLADITDEEANRIMIEIRYKGHHTFVSLGLLRSMSSESSLESKIKYKPEILSKIFVVFLSRLQDKVNGVLENIPAVEVSDQELPVEEDSEEETPDNNTPHIAPLSEVKGFTELKKELKLDDIEKISSNFPTESLDDIINAAIDKFQVDNQEVDEAYQRKIQQTSDESETETEPVFTVDYSEEKTQQVLKTTTAEEKVQNYINTALTNKTLTSAEIRSLKKVHEQRKQLKSPYDTSVSLDNFIQTPVSKELSQDKTKLDFTNPLVDDSFKSDIVGNFDKIYIKTTLKKDITACVAAIEKSGVMIKDYSVEEKKTATDRYEIHKLTLKPLDGKESTVFFRIPIIDSEGEMMGSSIRYKMRKMRTDLPIRKISATKVALTSNYSKLFVFRTERKAFDPNAYLVDYLRKSYLSEENGILKIVPGKKALSEVTLPTDYYALATEFNEIKTDKATFLLNYKERHNYLDEKTLKDIDSQGLVFLGYLPNKNILVMDNKSSVFDYTSNMTALGSVQELLGMDTSKVPKAFTMIKILGDNISLGVVLSYYMGLSSLLSVTGTQYKLLEANKQYKPLKNELVLKFEDHKLILTLDSTEQELLFNGFLYYKDYIKQHKLKDFDYKDIYLGVLEHRDASLIHLKELGLLEDLFLDPITVDVLESMKEPTEFFKLLLRANELLKDFKHPDMNDPEYARIRGYDRVPGLMYRALAESIRAYKIKGRVNSKIELDPYKVWNYITQDSTVKITEDVNPIVDLKEMEAVTLSGMDGLSKDATPMGLRRYHKKDIGLISEGTVDSSDVALNTYLTPYAKFKDIRGTVDVSNKDHVTNKAKAFSTSVLLAPMSENDDTKRIN